MKSVDIFKWLAIFSPIFSGIIGGIISHLLSNRSKRLDILYQHKIPAFKEMHKILVEYKLSVDRLVHVSEFLDDTQRTTSINTVNLLNDSFELNGLYFNKKSRQMILSLIGDIHNMCSFELAVLQDDYKHTTLPYGNMVVIIDKVIEQLYSDINLK
jgi:hypothetical protein